MPKEKNKKKEKSPKPLLSWEMKIKRENSALYFSFWFLLMVLISTLFVLIFKNFLGALAVFVLIITYLSFSQKLPQIKKINLYKFGLKYDEHLYFFADILFFKEIEIRDKKFLILFTNSRMMPEISLELPSGKNKEKFLHVLEREIPILNQNISLSNLHLDSYLGV